MDVGQGKVKSLKKKVRISNSSGSKLAVFLEPIGEERSLEAKGELYIEVDFLPGTETVSDILEFSVSENAITVYYTPKALAEWVG